MMQLYFDLAESMGRLAAQISKGRPEFFELIMVGQRFKEDFGERVFDIPFSFQPFTVAGLKGFLEKNIKETVSFINASYLAKERDMEIHESKTSSYENYNDLLLLRLKTDVDEHLFGRTVFADNVCRILFLDQFHLEMVAKGSYLYFKNIDKPGIVGRVGTVLGKHRINIAGFNLSRIMGGKAVSFVSLDNDVPEAWKNCWNRTVCWKRKWSLYDGFVKTLSSSLRCSLRYCSVRSVHLMPQVLRASNIKLLLCHRFYNFPGNHQRLHAG